MYFSRGKERMSFFRFDGTPSESGVHVSVGGSKKRTKIYKHKS